MKEYIGSRHPTLGGPGVVKILDNDSYRDLDPRLELISHSPSGFQWGYPGSGPAQLALAIIADATGDDNLALASYQRFKQEVIVGLPVKWSLTHEQVLGWLKTWVVKSQKSPEIEKFLDDFCKRTFGHSRKDPVCVTCGSKKVGEDDFEDTLSQREFHISRMCQECQNKTFK